MSTHTEILARAFQLQASGVPEKKAMQRAGREIARREKRRGKAASAGAPASPDSTGGLPTRAHAELATVLHRWVERIWSRPKRSRSRVIPKGDVQPEPSIQAAPIVAVEPTTPLSNDPRLQQHFPAPLVVTDFSRARIIPDSELGPPQFQDHVTAAWRRSIQQNEELARYRAQQSAAHRTRTRYIG
jgi:hypothetical protein